MVGTAERMLRDKLDGFMEMMLGRMRGLNATAQVGMLADTEYLQVER